jgi:C4-dicarboxylate-specific signal transduction histidine kinase
MTQSRFKSAGVQFEILNDSSTQVKAVSSQLTQTLMELVGNSLDAVRNQAEAWVRVEAHDDQDWVKITVTDSGKVAPDVAARMMEPFFTTKEPGEGVGLSLSLSRSLIQSWGGELRFVADAPHTQFEIRLPGSSVRSIPQADAAA